MHQTKFYIHKIIGKIKAHFLYIYIYIYIYILFESVDKKREKEYYGPSSDRYSVA